ncbi:glyoxylase-like metal-dependent hydrolase (beta-lactamase superfamily II) [Paenibacillus cellulosilyticus]|uniref:Glyoxylase-like metal-dependent hydrolase (Beta-lactamase superfamily II) n=1 Tax=Paenibacillus cellulosilyticus TaxID=375489 RepID=A0A2V2YLR8_9BACL|nr:MBL fold metallo-hydrolase [Paenibacillus cellulosilyticus]PWV95194.1 glyoxylase-like metal-dependent hydrolase (beta-lactamase superfamily II) [Paenibacillus cellulosilyticus]QKS46052.1 MBL fold metallo-hydrolase [Paenibacillus cellulosilyticus]
MRVTNGVHLVAVTNSAMGKPDTVYPVLLTDGTEAVLIDTGYPGRLVDLQQGIADAGVDRAQIAQVIITHQDIDHIGGLPALLDHVKADRPVEVLAHPFEVPYIQGEKRLIKVTDEALAKMDAVLPPGTPEAFKNRFKALLLSPPSAPVDRTITDGQRLPICGGIIVIETPGHTPGHISLYHEPTRTLIAADALMIVDGELRPSLPQTCVDYGQAVRSLERFADYAIDQVICYHGGVYSTDVNRRIAELAAETPSIG